MTIASAPSFVIDCPDAGELGRFHGELLERSVRVDGDETR